MKKIWIILIAVLLILITAGTVYYFTVTSPKYSLMKIKKAFDAHDITTFEEYVDVNGVVNRIITDLPGLINLGNAADFLGAEAGQILAYLVQGNIIKQIDESVRTFIERGHFDQNLTANGTISKVLKEVPLNTIEVVQLGEIRKEGKICKVPLDLYVKDYDGNIRIEFMMRDKGWNWQIAELSNLSAAVNELKELKRTLPYRNLVQTALFMARSIKNIGNRTQAISDIAVEIAKSGKTEMADSLFSEALEVAKTINKEDIHRGIALSDISKQMAKSGKMEMALDVAKLIVSRDSTFVDRDTASRNIENRDRALSAIACEMAKSGKIEMALDIAKTMEGFQGREDLLLWIAFEKAKSGKTETAIDVAKTVKQNGPRGEALSWIAFEMAKSGNMEMALDVAKSIVFYPIRRSTLSSLIIELVKTGKTEMALGVTKSIEDKVIRAEILADVAVEIAKSGKTEMADSLFSEALGVAKSVEDDRFRSFTFSDIAVEMVKAGKTELALDTAKKIVDSNILDRALSSIAVEMAKTGKTEMALQTANSMNKNKPFPLQGYTFMNIALNLSQQQMTKDQEKQIATRIMSMR